MMSLFYFEFRKLLLNKKTVSLLVCLFILYSLMGFVTSMFLIGNGKSYRVYEELAAGYEGPLDVGKAAWAKKVYEEISARYGTDSRMIARSIKDQPETMLALKYNEFTERVDEYWNGTPPESAEEPYGIALLESKLSELEMQGKQNTFAYTKLSSSLKRLTALSFTLIRKYSQQLIINADKQGASKSREHITFISGRFSAFLLRNRTLFLRVGI